MTDDNTIRRLDSIWPKIRSSRCRLVTISDLYQSDAEQWKAPNCTGDTLALLQYTSGSTAQPRGVMVTHRNLIHNLHAIQHCFQVEKSSKHLTWLPHYHDMGLIGGLLEPVFGGCQTRVLSPMDFLSDPASWLCEISSHRAEISGGPCFAYDLCIRAIDLEQYEHIDLTTWRLAFNGAEPIRSDVIDRFTRKFAPIGFRRQAFCPCYGLAESTLIVASARAGDGPFTARIDDRQLRNGGARIVEEHSATGIDLISSGRMIDGTRR